MVFFRQGSPGRSVGGCIAHTRHLCAGIKAGRGRRAKGWGGGRGKATLAGSSARHFYRAHHARVHSLSPASVNRPGPPHNFVCGSEPTNHPFSTQTRARFLCLSLSLSSRPVRLLLPSARRRIERYSGRGEEEEGGRRDRIIREPRPGR